MAAARITVMNNGSLRVEGTDGTVRTYAFADPRGVPAAVRDLVTASVVISERHKLDERGSVRVVARRDTTTGRLVWSAVLDPTLDVDDPLVRESAEQLMLAVRRRVGG